MICFPNAKINIGLNIVKKRVDGFHDLESVFYAVGLTDALEIILSPAGGMGELTFSSSGIDIPGNAEENLCVKAYRLIEKDQPLPSIHVHLHKHIPIGAGLGGGSADAAFFIKLMNEKLELNLAWGEMHHYAKQLGSDCSFFISNRPSFVKGKGDEFEGIALDLKNHFICLVYPKIHINTAKAYSGVRPKVAERDLEQDLLSLPVEQWKGIVHNDFEDSIFPQFPQIKLIKDQLYALGASYAAMSGSGSTVYGIFKELPGLQEHFPGMFYWEGAL